MKKVLREYSKSPTRESSSCKLSKTQMWIPSMSGVSETAACPPSPITDDTSLYRLPPPLYPPISNSSSLFTQCQPLYAICCTIPALLYFSRYCTVSLKMFSLVFVCLVFLCIIYVKSIINIL